MPTWPTLWPGLLTGDNNYGIDSKPQEILFDETMNKDRVVDRAGLSKRQQ